MNEPTYLQDLPELIANYGLNKTLTTRSLTIDWKHRNTEMYLRSPDLLDKVKPKLVIATNLYEVYGETYSRVSFKTDRALRMPCMI